MYSIQYSQTKAECEPLYWLLHLKTEAQVTRLLKERNETDYVAMGKINRKTDRTTLWKGELKPEI